MAAFGFQFLSALLIGLSATAALASPRTAGQLTSPSASTATAPKYHKAYGLLNTPQEGSLGPTVWEDASTNKIVQLAETIKHPKAYPHLTKLLRRALLTQYDPYLLTDHESAALLEARLSLLNRLGFFEDSADLYIVASDDRSIKAEIGLSALIGAGRAGLTCLETLSRLTDLEEEEEESQDNNDDETFKDVNAICQTHLDPDNSEPGKSLARLLAEHWFQTEDNQNEPPPQDNVSMTQLVLDTYKKPKESQTTDEILKRKTLYARYGLLSRAGLEALPTLNHQEAISLCGSDDPFCLAPYADRIASSHNDENLDINKNVAIAAMLLGQQPVPANWHKIFTAQDSPDFHILIAHILANPAHIQSLSGYFAKQEDFPSQKQALALDILTLFLPAQLETLLTKSAYEKQKSLTSQKDYVMPLGIKSSGLLESSDNKELGLTILIAYSVLQESPAEALASGVLFQVVKSLADMGLTEDAQQIAIEGLIASADIKN